MRPKPVTVKVHPSRLDWNGGDIDASYSADKIDSGTIRKPFVWQSNLMVTTSLRSMGGHMYEAEAYKIVLLREFSGTPTTYSAKGKDDCWEAARNDPLGFYHGMTVKSGRETYVMVGPPIRFVADKTLAEPAVEQLSLL